MDGFVIHACEQVLRFTGVDEWNDLTEAVKVQLGFNMGVVALGLNLTKEEGVQYLVNVRKGIISMQEFQEHLRSLVIFHAVEVNESNITKPFLDISK